jgi:sodium/proline symporter
MPHGGAVVAVLVVYLVAMLAIGIWAERRSKTKEDFILGGRTLGPWLAGLSYAASTSSAWVMLGFTGFVFSVGLYALWMIPGIWMGYALAWLWAGPRLQEEGRREGHLTLIDFLTARASGPMRGAINALAAVLICVSFTIFIAAQMRGAGQSFMQAFDVTMTVGVLIGAGAVLFYMFFGGFWAASMTDTIQGAIMGIVAIILPIATLVAAGGPGEVAAKLAANAPDGFFDVTGGKTALIFTGTVVGLFSAGFGTLGQPHLLNWMMAVKDQKTRVQGFWIAMIWGVIVYVGMATLALSARALAIQAAPEAVFFEVANQLLHPLLSGLVVAAVLSAIMSTVDSQLLVASAAVSHDMGLAKKLGGAEVLVTRVVMVAICAGAVALTFALPESIFSRALFAWAALGAAFGPIVAVRLFGVEPAPQAIFIAMLSGFCLTVFFYLRPDTPGDIAERVLPWLPSLALLLAWRQERKSPAAY